MLQNVEKKWMSRRLENTKESTKTMYLQWTKWFWSGYILPVIRPGETTHTEIWTLIENIAKIKSNRKGNKKSSQSQFFIPLTKNDRLNMIENQEYDPAGTQRPEDVPL